MSLKFSGKKNNVPLVIAISVAISIVANIFLIKTMAGQVSEKSIEKYVNENPAVLVESVNNYYEAMAANKGKNRAKNLKNYTQQVFHNKKDPIIGDKNSKKVVVEFFDYNCGYCKKVFGTISKVSDENKDVKFILKEMPILGPSSEAKSRVSIAAYTISASKYLQVHSLLMHKASSAHTVEKVAEVVSSLGFDKAALIKKANSDYVSNIITENKQLARDLGISGTPAFIIGEEFIDGALPYESLSEKVKKLK